MRRFVFLALFLLGCAGTQRDCASCWAESTGADWIVVQYRCDGAPFNCWKLPSTSIDNERSSDGIFWEDPSGNLVHISGHYSRVQVSNGRWDEAARTVGVDPNRCQNGVYRLTPDAGMP